MEQEQTNQNQAASNGEAANKSTSSQALLAFGSRKLDQFFFEDDKNFINQKPVPLTNFFTSLSRQIYSVACGAMHTLVLTTNGEVYSFGCNDDGALGRTGTGNKPSKVDLDAPIDMISAGESHSVACNSAHSLVYHWGVYRNSNKGHISKSETPLRIGEDEFKKKKLKRVISGANHTLALVDGKIYAWGDAEVGILGRLSTSRRKLDQGLKIEGMGVKGVVEEIYTGASHAFLKKTEKKKNESYTAIYAWGLNSCGQLGIGNTENQHNPVEVTVLRDKNIKSITGGENHTIVLTEDGEVYSFGKNDDGQLGLGQDFEEKEESEPEEEEEEQKKTPAKPAKPPAKSTSKKGKGKGKKGGSQKKGQDAEEDKAEEKEEDTEKKDGEQEKEDEKEKEAELEKEAEKPAESQESAAEKKDEEKDAGEAKEAAAEPEKGKTPKAKSNKKKEKEPENAEEENKSSSKSVKNPQKVEIANVDKIFSGSNFNYAVTKEQEIYSWGLGSNFVLGNSNEDSVYKPTKLAGDLFGGKRIVALGLGSLHVVAFGVDKDAKDPELEEEAFAKVGEQAKITRKGTTGKKGRGKKGEEEESNEKDIKKNLTASLEEETEEKEEKEEKNKRGQKKSLKRKATDEGEEDNGVKKVKKSPTKEKEAAPTAESKMEEEKPAEPAEAAAEDKKLEEEAPKANEEQQPAATDAKEDTGKMEEEKPAENKEEEAKPEEKAAEPEEKAAEPEEKAAEPTQPVEEEKKVETEGEKVDQPQVEAEGEKKEESKEVQEAANESENKAQAQEGTA